MVGTMKKIKNIFLVCLLVSLLGFLFYAFFTPFFKVSFIDVQVNQEIKNIPLYKQQEEKIIQHLNIYKGRFLWKLNLKDIVQELYELYPGAEISVIRKFPDQLIVLLERKQIPLLLLKEGGSFYSVSYEGEIGVKKNSGESFDFPVLRGRFFWDDISLRKRAISVFSHIPKESAFFSGQNISEVSYNKNNDSLLLFLISGRFILELQGPPSPKKIKNIEFVLNYLNQRGEQGRHIDARMNKKIIVKKIN